VTAYHPVVLVTGLRDLIIAAGVSPVVVGPITQLGVDAGVALTPFPVDENDATGTVVAGVQVRIRGARTAGSAAPLNLSETIRTALVAVRMATVNGVHVASCRRDRQAPLGLDDQGRYELADTYYLLCNRAELT
jgi:hypothetical protein